MTIPDYQTIMLPLLKFASDGDEHRFREAVQALAEHFGLSEVERAELLPSGRYPTFDNRVGWASTYMKKAGLIEGPRRGYLKITPRGLSVLAERPEAINAKFLDRYPEFVAFREKGDKSASPPTQVGAEESDKQTPIEAMESAYQTVRNNLVTELQQRAKGCFPGIFRSSSCRGAS